MMQHVIIIAPFIQGVSEMTLNFSRLQNLVPIYTDLSTVGLPFGSRLWCGGVRAFHAAQVPVRTSSTNYCRPQ